MTEGLFDRYFRLLAGQLPAAEYGVIAYPTDDEARAASAAEAEALVPECLC
jgi:hypothetical protein